MMNVIDRNSDSDRHLDDQDAGEAKQELIDSRTFEIMADMRSQITAVEIMDSVAEIGIYTPEEEAISRITKRAQGGDIDPDLLIILNGYLKPLAEAQAEKEDE